MNKFVGIGNLGQDPQLRTTQSGKSVCNFNIAIDRRYWTGQGDQRELVRETDWVPVVTWGGLAENCARYLFKGSKVSVEGALRPRSYNDKEGKTQRVFEISADAVEFLTPPPNRQETVVSSQEKAAL